MLLCFHARKHREEATDGGAAEGRAETRLADWIDRQLGARVRSIVRQNRWRPAWFIDIDGPNGPGALYVRGERTIKSVSFPLEHEYRVLTVLEANRIRVPHIHGMCSDPLSIVMDKVHGRADLSTAAGEEERRAVMDDYVAQLAAIHGIDVGAFEATGLERPCGPEAIALHLFEQFVALYRGQKSRPEPFLEFLIAWVRRNVPKHRDRIALVCGDPAQFLFAEGRVTALIDFEIAHLGDPMHDVAGLLLRDMSEPLGDIGRALRRYRELTGEEIDEAVFDFHLIQWAACTPISMSVNLSTPHPTGDMVQYFEWSTHLGRVALEVIARRSGVALPPISPAPARQAWQGVMAESLIGAIRALPAADDFSRYQRDSAAKLAEFMRRSGELAPDFERAEIEETNALLGRRHNDWAEADAALEWFVLAAGPEHDAALIKLFYARTRRRAVLLEPVLSRKEMAQPIASLSSLIGRGGCLPVSLHRVEDHSRMQTMATGS